MEDPISPTIVQPPNFVIGPVCSTLTHEISINNFNLSQVPISQIYTSRKMKHPSFRKRAGSGSMPYYVPLNRNRQRTKSESADASNPQHSQSGAESSMEISIVENFSDRSLIMDMDNGPLHHVSSNPQFNKIKVSQLKKSKSMESLLLKSSQEETFSEKNSSTLEFPTLLHRIQKLKFNE